MPNRAKSIVCQHEKAPNGGGGMTDQTLDALILALPYVESAEDDPCYKPGAVAKVVKAMREAIESAEQRQTRSEA